MRRNHRAAQRQIEKDFAFLQVSTLPIPTPSMDTIVSTRRDLMASVLIAFGLLTDLYLILSLQSNQLALPYPTNLLFSLISPPLKPVQVLSNVNSPLFNPLPPQHPPLHPNPPAATLSVPESNKFSIPSPNSLKMVSPISIPHIVPFRKLENKGG